MSTELTSREDVQERPSGVWDYISPSRLNLWLKCPLAFRLRYIDGLVLPTTPSQFIGRAVHRALEMFYRHQLVGVELSTDSVNRELVASWDQAAAEDGVAFEDLASEAVCREQALGLVATYLGQRPSNESRPLAVEVAAEAPLVDPQTGEHLGLPLLGIMDLVLAEPDGPVIADFKTAARGGELLEVTHEIQLTSYGYLFRHISPQPEGALEIRSLIKTKTPKIETHRYVQRSARHFRRLFAVIRAYLDDLDGGRHVFRPGLTCSSCDFRHTRCQNWEG